jgi:hypothetical protein
MVRAVFYDSHIIADYYDPSTCAGLPVRALRTTTPSRLSPFAYVSSSEELQAGGTYQVTKIATGEVSTDSPLKAAAKAHYAGTNRRFVRARLNRRSASRATRSRRSETASSSTARSSVMQ